MSQWTHVAGIIRLDSLGYNLVMGMEAREKNRLVREAAVKAMGRTTPRDLELSDREEWNRCDVPQGSEGSLQYDVIANSERDTHSLSWGCVAIWGDLRDFGYEDVPKIKEWFQKCMDRLRKPEGFKDPETMTMFEKIDYMLASFSVREAVLSIDVEGEPREVIALFDPDKPNQIRLGFVKLA